jgi:hypothetical protein
MASSFLRWASGWGRGMGWEGRVGGERGTTHEAVSVLRWASGGRVRCRGQEGQGTGDGQLLLLQGHVLQL